MTSRFPVVVDIETTGLDFTRDTIRGIGVHHSELQYFYTELDAAKTTLEALRDMGAYFVMQNGRFDVKFLRRAGINIECDADTMLMARCLRDRPRSLALDSLAAFYLGLPSWKGDVDFNTSDMAALAAYCLEDCRITFDLFSRLSDLLLEQEQDKFFERLMEASRLLTSVEYRGMGLNWAAVAALKAQLGAEAADLTRTLNTAEEPLIRAWQLQEMQKKASKTKDAAKAMARYKTKPPEFNWASPTQVLWALKAQGADVQVWDPKKKEKVESSNDAVLQQNKGVSFCGPLSDLRERTKLQSALEGYEQAAGSDGRIHCSFSLTTTETGRLASSGPNLQNVDRSARVRGLFVPPEGRDLLVGDLAQIEVRMAAHYARDPRLITMFQKGEDFYGTIAVQLLGVECGPNEVKKRHPDLRAVAKTIGLSILYGVGANRLRDGIERSTRISYSAEESRRIIRNYFDRFEGLRDLRIRIEAKLAKDGFFTNLFGRRIYLSGDDVRFGVNYLLQSSASDLMLFRQLDITADAKKAGLDEDLISLVHDEFLREVSPPHAKELEALSKRHLERIDDIEFRVPLICECSIGSSWAVKS